MIRGIAGFVAVAMLFGCQHESGDSPELLPTFYLADAPVRLNAVGDWIRYDAAYSGAYFDGSGEMDVSGVCRDQLYSTDLAVTDVPPLLLKRFNCEGDLGVVFTQDQYVTLSIDTGTLIHYDGGGYYHNWPTGGVVLPASMSVGASWSNNYYAVNYDGVNHSTWGYPRWHYSETYTVDEVGYVGTDIGVFEAYKISFTSNREPSTNVNDKTYSDSGTIWYYPGVGVIKKTASGKTSSYTFNYQYEYTLAGTSMYPLLVPSE